MPTDHRRGRAIAGLTLLACLATAWPAVTVAQAPTSHVLLLDVADPLRPAAQAQQSAFVRHLTERTARHAQLYLENLDLVRFGTQVQRSRTMDWLVEKYRAVPLDAIVVIGRPALVAAHEIRTRLGTAPPIVVLLSANDPIAASADSLRRAGVSPVIVQSVERAVIRHALTLFPQTRTVVTVTDDADRAGQIAAIVHEVTGGGVGSRALVGLRMSAYRDSLAALRSDEVVFYWAVSRDGDGVPWIPSDALAAMEGASTRPIFGTADNLVGLGAIGGPSVSYAAVGRALADRTADLLDGGDPSALPVVEHAAWRWLYDWPRLRRFGADRSRIPDGAEFVGRPARYFASHPAESSVAALLLLGQFVLIVWLVRRGNHLDRARAELQEMSDRIMRVQDEDLSGLSRPLEDDLATELRQLAREVSEAHGLPVSVVAEGDGRLTDPHVMVPLYRIAQEALLNTVHHARATMAEVKLSLTREQALLRIRDDGVGFVLDPHAMPGIGLVSMRERARAIGGRLMISTAPREGTLVMATIPRRDVY